MSQLFELIPLVGFFVGYKLYDIYVAVSILMILMTISLILVKVQKKNITNMQYLSWLLVIVFGTITLAFRNEIFIKWKPTVLNWGFGLAFLISHFFGKENFTERLLGSAKIKAPKKVMEKLNFAWVLFFILTGTLNIIIAYRFTTETWVNFKLFGLFGLTLAFAIGQAVYLKIKLDKNSQ